MKNQAGKFAARYVKFLSICIVLTLVLGAVGELPTAFASGTTYYVDANNGDDSNDGQSESEAFESIQKAHDTASSGDEILIMNGVYDSNPYESGNKNVVSIVTSGLTFKNYPGHQPIIKKNIDNGIYNGFASYDANDITIEGLIFEGNALSVSQEEADAFQDYVFDTPTPYPGSDASYTRKFRGTGIHIRDGNEITIRNNTVYLWPSAGIIASKSDNVSILNNVVYNNAWWGAVGSSGISVINSEDFDTNTTTYKTKVEGNLAFGNMIKTPWTEYQVNHGFTDGNGIIIDSNTANDGYNGKTIVQNNIAYNNGGSGVQAFLSNNVDLINNTVYNNNVNTDKGNINHTGNGSGKVVNNISCAREDKKAYLFNTSSVVDYNIYYAPSGGSQQPQKDGVNDLVADPLFMDIENYDFHLQSNSPAIDNADSSYAPDTDYDGTNRPVGNGDDQGALEYDSPLASYRSGWSATANPPSTSSPPENALDGDVTTRYSTLAGQVGDEWFQLDMGKANTFNRIELDQGQWTNGYPMNYEVYVSNDGTTWTGPVATGTGTTSKTVIDLPTKTARYLKIEQTGTSESWRWWSIAEIHVLRAQSAESYLVSFNGNGETGGSVPVAGSTPYIQGSTVTLPGNTGNLVKTGSSFVGWNTAADGSGTSYAPSSTYTMGTEDVQFFAEWN